MGIQIKLTPFEMELARCLANARSNSNRANGVPDKKVGKNKDSRDIDLTGMMGEMAFCKWANLYPDLSIKPRSGSHDATLNDLTIDVKSTDNPNGNLLAYPEKSGDKASDIYVLVIATPPQFEIVGYATKEMMFSPASLTDKGHGKTHQVRRENLLDMSTLG